MSGQIPKEGKRQQKTRSKNTSRQHLVFACFLAFFICQCPASNNSVHEPRHNPYRQKATSDRFHQTEHFFPFGDIARSTSARHKSTVLYPVLFCRIPKSSQILFRTSGRRKYLYDRRKIGAASFGVIQSFIVFPLACSILLRHHQTSADIGCLAENLLFPPRLQNILSNELLCIRLFEIQGLFRCRKKGILSSESYSPIKVGAPSVTRRKARFPASILRHDRRALCVYLLTAVFVISISMPAIFCVPFVDRMNAAIAVSFGTIHSLGIAFTSTILNP